MVLTWILRCEFFKILDSIFAGVKIIELAQSFVQTLNEDLTNKR